MRGGEEWLCCVDAYHRLHLPTHTTTTPTLNNFHKTAACLFRASGGLRPTAAAACAQTECAGGGRGRAESVCARFWVGVFVFCVVLFMVCVVYVSCMCGVVWCASVLCVDVTLFLTVVVCWSCWLSRTCAMQTGGVAAADAAPARPPHSQSTVACSFDVCFCHCV